MEQNAPGAANNAEDFTKQFMSQMFGNGMSQAPQQQQQQQQQHSITILNHGCRTII